MRTPDAALSHGKIPASIWRSGMMNGFGETTIAWRPHRMASSGSMRANDLDSLAKSFPPNQRKQADHEHAL